MNLLQKHLYQILVAIDRVCIKHDIPYFLVGGTMLGAVRHKGFIPWDDDLDIGMMRCDYERFLKICPNVLNNEFRLQHFSNEPSAPCSYAKILDTRTEIYVKSMEHLPAKKHLYVDVFPFDGVPRSTVVKKIQTVSLSLLRGLIEIKFINVPNPRWRNRVLVSFLRPVLPGQMLNQLFSQISRWCPADDSDWCCAFHTPYAFIRGTFHKTWVLPTVSLPFESGMFPCPANVDACLKRTYGDYMTLPPVEDRVTHDIALVKYNDF